MVVIVTIVKHTCNRCRHSREQVVVIVVVAALQRCCCTASQRDLDSFLLLFTVIRTVYVLLFIKCVVFIMSICDERFVLLSSCSNTGACTVEHHNDRSSNDIKSGEIICCCNVILFRLPCYCAFCRTNIT